MRGGELMARRKWSWTEFRERQAQQVADAANELRDFWPLTLRQIHYRLVSNGTRKNTRSAYTDLSKLIKWMRIDEKIPWYAITDRIRSVSAKRGFENLEQFIKLELRNMFQGYSRCRVQGQDKYIEIWVEKDTLKRIFEDVVWPYCMRCVVCRGYQSVSFLADFYQRATRAIDLGQEPVILYFGDLDASGVQMFEATQETLENELDLAGVTFKRCGLLPEHIERYSLPNDPKAIKKTDTRYRTFSERFGDVAVELDAMPPRELQNLLRECIEAEIDLDRFQSEKMQEEVDQEAIKEFREEASATVMNLYWDKFKGLTRQTQKEIRWNFGKGIKIQRNTRTK